MNALDQVKYVPMGLLTIATNATASAAVVLDTLGWDRADILIGLPVATATNSSAKFAALQVTAGDTTAYTSSTAVAGLVGTTNSTAATNQFVIAAQNDTSNPQVTRLVVDKGYTPERYLFVVWQGAASHNTVSANAILSRGKIGPDTDTERGVAVSGTQYVG